MAEPDPPGETPLDTSPDSTIGDQFMLAEFENMRFFHQEETAINERRVDILLAVASGAAAGIVLLAQGGLERQFLVELSVLASTGLLVIGIPVFMDTLQRDITAVDYIRALNRVRAYFAGRAPSIMPYLLMPIESQYPPYGDLSSSRRASAAINSVAGGALFATLHMLEYGETAPDHVAQYAAAVVMALIYLGHLGVCQLVYWRAARKAQHRHSMSLVEADGIAARKARPRQSRKRQPKN